MRRKQCKKPVKLSLVRTTILFGLMIASTIWIQKNYYIPKDLAIMIIIICVVFALLYALKPYIAKKIKRAKYRKSGLKTIDQMDGLKFEELLAGHFEKLGYHAEVTQSSNDFGADVVLTQRGIKTVVQAKRYQGTVGIKAVQEIIAAKAYYHADKAMVVTNSFFTPSAIKLAKASDVVLWDRNDIKNKFKL